MSEYNQFNHDAYARSRPRDDFWGQIKRTVKGKPASNKQIELIISAIKIGLDIRSGDNLLDLCCGNGALSSKLYDSLSKLMGVDNSEYLISVAKEFFETPPNFTFKHSEIIDFMNNMENRRASIYNKCLCYGSFSYLDQNIIDHIFEMMGSKYKNIRRFYIGNIPDRSKSSAFFVEATPLNLDLSSNESVIGRWWTKSEISALAARYGWSANLIEMSKDFYASEYRFDAIFTRDI